MPPPRPWGERLKHANWHLFPVWHPCTRGFNVRERCLRIAKVTCLVGLVLQLPDVVEGRLPLGVLIFGENVRFLPNVSFLTFLNYLSHSRFCDPYAPGFNPSHLTPAPCAACMVRIACPAPSPWRAQNHRSSSMRLPVSDRLRPLGRLGVPYQVLCGCCGPGDLVEVSQGRVITSVPGHALYLQRRRPVLDRVCDRAVSE